MNVLVLNCGSSSVKFQIIATDRDLIERDADLRLASGVVERIGGHALVTLQAQGSRPVKKDEPLRDHQAAVDLVLKWIISSDAGIEGIRTISDLHAVGHRVVHGGEHFNASVKIDDDVIEGIEQYMELAPLHNPANLKGIRAAQDILGNGIPQVAVFDTAFHTTMPEVSFLYGIPYHLYRRLKIRRYGFHGTSHRYVAYRYRKIERIERNDVNIITLHLGNGCSACAVKNGDSYDTSMGFTPLEGLVMGTRCGDIDPAIVEYLAHKEGMTLYDIETMLNKQSGLLGLSGLTADMRDLLAEESEHQDRRAGLAIDVFCQRVRKVIGAYFVAMGQANAIIFTGGIGENAPSIRKRVCDGLACLGVELDDEKNTQLYSERSGQIAQETSRLKVYVIPTNEELLIARDTFSVVAGVPTFDKTRSSPT
ncbi:MAG: acetate kinase [Acidiferrobacterales bacterium]